MSENGLDAAIGFAQEIPGGFVFEIGNRWVNRRIHCISGRVSTTSLVNNKNCEEYLEMPGPEFEVEITGEGQKLTLTSKDFTYKGYSTPNWDNSTRTLNIMLETDLNDQPFIVSVVYEARAGENFIEKWLEIAPCPLEGFVISHVSLEDIRFKDLVEGVIPQQRYPKSYANYEDNVHEEPDKANTSEPEKRFMFGDLARSVVTYWGYNEGLYFFTGSLFGEESFYRPKGLSMGQREWMPLTEGLVTGRAVIGAYAGGAEIGFKRYTEHILNHWSKVRDKSIPVAWNTWLITREGDNPVLADYDRNLLVDYLGDLSNAGFYDLLKLDFGWESDRPLTPDPIKFPNGLGEIVRRAKDGAGLDMGYWINPFSANYRRSSVHTEHPEYLVPGKVSSRSGASAICVMTEYSDYVKQRLAELVEDFNARVIYWDGADWNIPECTARNHEHRSPQELKIKAWKKLADICSTIHGLRDDLLISAFNLPFDNHRLCVLDQEQISDTYQFPTGQAELIQRRQIYQMTFEHPYKAIYGSWYGVNWHEAGENNLKRPLRDLIHAEMSMVGNGLAQAGGSIDLKQASPEFLTVLKKLFAFRKKFEKYFEVYQHVLGFPDGENIDGSGHLIDESGFIVLINPSGSEQSIKVPLAEAELELDSDKEYELTDWSNLERGMQIGSAKPAASIEIDLMPFEVKYIGINIKS